MAAAPQLLAALLAAALAAVAHGRFMKCGPGVPLCGVLALESGFGRNAYHHPGPVVHGLWPQTGHYGSSQCIRPQEAGAPREVFSCYRDPGSQRKQELWFESHEWSKHGVCAGARSDDDFFEQVCKLSSQPLEIMERAKRRGFRGMVTALRKARMPVYAVDSRNDQVELSACAGKDGRWKLAPVARFKELCGGGGKAPPKRRPSPPHGQHRQGVCRPDHRGPRCRQASDCEGVSGCVRCAHSGYCTNVPAFTDEAEVPPAGLPGAASRAASLPPPAVAALLACGLLTGLLAAGALRRWRGDGPLARDDYLSI